MISLARLVIFIGFIALGLAVVISQRDTGQRRRRINRLIVYVLAIHLMLAVTGRDAWPFSAYPLIQKRSHEESLYRKIVFSGVDRSGVEWLVHPDAWSPVSPPALMQWFVVTYPRLGQNDRDIALHFLLQRAEQQRLRMQRGESPPRMRFFRRAAAPDWWLYTAPREFSPTPLAGLRVYREEFRPRDRFTGRSDAARVMIGEIGLR